MQQVRNIEKCLLGSGKKEIQDSEKKNLPIARRSIVANCNIKKGDIFSIENIIPKRPATGLSPVHWEQVIGKVSKSDYEEDELIKEDELL